MGVKNTISLNLPIRALSLESALAGKSAPDFCLQKLNEGMFFNLRPRSLNQSAWAAMLGKARRSGRSEKHALSLLFALVANKSSEGWPHKPKRRRLSLSPNTLLWSTTAWEDPQLEGAD